jgi:hypothetical protein
MDFSDLGKRIEILRFLPRKLALSRRKLAEGVKRRQRQACFAKPVRQELCLSRDRDPRVA